MPGKSRQQILLIAALLLVGFFVANKVVFDRVASAWKSKGNRLTELQQQLQQGRSLIDREQAVRQRWEYVRRNAFPSDTSTAEQQFFKAADRWAADSRVTISSMTPQWKRDAEDHMTYQARLDVSGSLSSLSRFLYEIEKDPAAVKLESVELAARDKEGRQLSLGLQVSALVLNPVSK